jgi:dihydropteroate synthase
VVEVRAFLQSRVLACLQAGIPRENVVLDPGFGFGKTLHHNLDLSANLDHIAEMGLPVMAGLSRKGISAQSAAATSNTARSPRRPTQ